MMARHPVAAALLFEGAVLLLGLLLALFFGLRPWEALHSPLAAIAISILLTGPVLLVAGLLSRAAPAWVQELERLTGQLVRTVFRHSPPGGVLGVALLAGFSEEFLFRGVIQTGLAGPLGPATALVAASVLFGLAHALSPAYFLAATLIGAYLGLVYHVTGNLLTVCLVHALYDWLVIRHFLRRAAP